MRLDHRQLLDEDVDATGWAAAERGRVGGEGQKLDKAPMRYYRDGVRSGEEIARWHWATCHGIVGFEQLAVETIDLTEAEKPARFIVDLAVKPDRSS